MTMTDAKAIRDETELSMEWTRLHPYLFRDAVVKFLAEHPAEDWDITAKMTSRSYLFVADRREK